MFFITTFENMIRCWSYYWYCARWLIVQVYLKIGVPRISLLAKWFCLFFHKQRAQVWIQIWEIPKHWYIFKILWWLCHEKYEELRIKKAIKWESCVWLFITQVHDVHAHMCVHDLNRCSACVSQHQATKCVLTHTCSIQSFRVTELDSWAAKNTHVHECIRRFQRNPLDGRCFHVHFNRGGAGASFLSAGISHFLSLPCLFPLFSFCVIILISYFLTPSISRHAPSPFISPLSCVVFFN